MLRAAPLVLAALLTAAPAAAATVADPQGDFLTTYTGPTSTNLDLRTASAAYDGTNFLLTATANGPLGGAGSLYVFGINRGAGTPRLTFGTPSVGAGVLFDAVAVLFPDGTGRIATFPAAGAPTITPLPGGAVTVLGNTVSGLFAASLLPSTGFSPADYTFSLWSRQRVDPTMDGTSAEIADFAPNFTASVPEPATWAAMILGLGLIGCAMRRRRHPARRVIPPPAPAC